MNLRVYFICLITLIFVGRLSVYAQMVNTDAYIKAKNIEIGINGAGGFEGVDTAKSPVLPGMHARSGSNLFGFVANPQLNNWATFDGDFFTPGGPENGWGIEIGSTDTLQFASNCSNVINSLNQIPGAITSFTKSGVSYNVDWEGSVAGLNIKISFFAQEDDLFYTNTISITNNSGKNIPEMYYYRNLDPDNNQSVHGNFATKNTIENQPTGECGIAHVSAKQPFDGSTSSDPEPEPDPGPNPFPFPGPSPSPSPSPTPNPAPAPSGPESYLGLAAAGDNWRAIYGGFTNRDGSDIWNGVEFTQTIGAKDTADEAIALAYKIQNLAVGATETFKFVTILSSAQAPKAINKLMYLSYPEADTAAGAIKSSYIDTVKICAGNSAPISINGATINKFDWTWYPEIGLSATTGISTIASPTITTTYTLTGKPINSCFEEVSKVFVVQAKQGVSVNAVADITTCSGLSVPESNFSSVPENASFSWTNSDTSIGLAASGVGNVPLFIAKNNTASVKTATITVTPSLPDMCNGMSTKYTIVVNPDFPVNVNSVTICEGDTALLTAEGGISYTWSNGATSNGINTALAIPTSTATYTVTADNEGCKGYGSATVTVNSLPIMVFPASQSVCNGGNVLPSDFQTVPAGSTFEWSSKGLGIGVPLSGQNNVSAFVAANNTSFILVDTIVVTPELNSCIGSPAHYYITVFPTPDTPFVSPAVICKDRSATLKALTPGGMYEWFDSNVNGTLLTTGNTYTTPVLNNPVVYYVRTTSAEGCVSDFGEAQVSISSGLAIDAGMDDTICFGENTILSALPDWEGNTYNWSPSTGLSDVSIRNPVANPSVNTTYTVTVTSVDGCVGSDEVTVYSNPQLSIATIANNVNCNGACDGSITTTATGGSGVYVYQWSNLDTNSLINSLCPGGYNVTVTDSWNCSTTTDIIITEPTPLQASISAQTQLTCNSICDGTATIVATGGTPLVEGYKYNWNTSSVQTVAFADSLCAQMYICTVTDSNNCSVNKEVYITEPSPVLIASIPDDTICYGGSTTILASASGGNGGVYSYTFTPQTGLSNATINNPVANPLVKTTYTVYATDSKGCLSTSDEFILHVTPQLKVQIDSDKSICLGDSIQIRAEAMDGNGGPYTYLWSPANGLNNTLVAIPMAKPNLTSSYVVEAQDGCSVASKDTVIITVMPLPVPQFSSNITSGCNPICVNFNDETSITKGSIKSWLWNLGDGSGFQSTNSFSHCYTISGNYSIMLKVTSDFGCTSDTSISNYINVFENPIAVVDAPETVKVDNADVQFTDKSIGASYWFWNFNDTYTTIKDNTSDNKNPVHIYREEGTYTASLIVTSEHGCKDSTEVTIVVEPAFTFYIPNSFSPNGDNLNDEFYFVADRFLDFEMSIYNRWGNLIFHTNDISKHWDGTSDNSNKVVQQDTYVYVVVMTDENKKQHKYTGTVTLTR